MEQSDKVIVYSFRIFDPRSKSMRVAAYKGTREAVALHLGGEVLEGTEHEVSRSEIDEHGSYRRVATGWGELG